MGLNLKYVKVEALKYHTYGGVRNTGDVYDVVPADAEKMEAKGLVKLKKKEQVSKLVKDDAKPV